MSNVVSSTLLGLGIFLLIITPFIMYGVNRKLKKNRKQKKLFQVCEEQHLSFTKTEISDDFCMGIDVILHKLIFVKFVDKESRIQVIDLSLIKHAESRNNSRNLSGDSFGSVIDCLELVLKHKDTSKSDIHLELFNTENSLQISTELLVVDKWVKLINESLKK
jgi:hypothetical protein